MKLVFVGFCACIQCSLNIYIFWIFLWIVGYANLLHKIFYWVSPLMVAAAMAGQLIKEWTAIHQFPAATQEKLVNLLSKLKDQVWNFCYIIYLSVNRKEDRDRTKSLVIRMKQKWQSITDSFVWHGLVKINYSHSTILCGLIEICYLKMILLL